MVEQKESKQRSEWNTCKLFTPFSPSFIIKYIAFPALLRRHQQTLIFWLVVLSSPEPTVRVSRQDLVKT